MTAEKMDTSFALKRAVQRIESCFDRVRFLNENADVIADSLKETRKEECEPYSGEIRFLRLIELFSQLPEEELVFELLALGQLLEKILETNDVVICFKGDKQLPTKEDAVYPVYLMAKGLFGLRYFYTDKHLTYLEAYLRRFRYKSNFLDVLSDFIPTEIFQGITADFSYDFASYAQIVFEYYFQFYSRGENQDPKMLAELDSLRNLEKVRFIIEKTTTQDIDIQFTFKANFAKPTEHVLQELEDFKNLVSMHLIACNGIKKESYSPPYHVLTDYIRTNSGKLPNLGILFSKWARLIKVYDFRVKDGLSWEQVRRKCKVSDPRDDFENAKKHILSAINHTFPLL